MGDKPTHRLVKIPKMNARQLADYMAASERARRRIVRDCKYRPIVRVIQHDRAKNAVTKFLLDGNSDCLSLTEAAERVRGMMADDDFEREVLDNNADYIDAFAASFPNLGMPEAERYREPKVVSINLNGVEVNPGVQFALRRTTRTNKIKTGLVTLRYAKRKSLQVDVAQWQSSFLYGYRLQMDDGDEAEPEHKLCVTIDAFAGIAHGAPGNALTNYRNMEAACQSIAERWDSIPPPEDAVLSSRK